MKAALRAEYAPLIAAYLANGGTVTRCRTAYAAPTQAKVR